MDYRYPLTIVLVILVAGLSPAIAADLAVNGSFEDQPVPTNSYVSPNYGFSPGWANLAYIVDGDGGIPAWWVNGGSVGPQYGDFGNRNSPTTSFDFTVPSGFLLDSITWDAATADPVDTVQYSAALLPGSIITETTGAALGAAPLSALASTTYNAIGDKQWHPESLPIPASGPGTYRLEFDVDPGNPSGWDLLVDNLVIETTRGSGVLRDLGDLVWNDLNADGIQDAGESGLAGVTVNLLNDAGTPIGATVTDGIGDFVFSGLTDGAQYELEFVLPAGYTFSPLNAGGALVDSDAILATGRTGLITLTSDDYSWDAGMVPEPATMIMLAAGLPLLLTRRRS
jgi:hypothetical protein